MSEAHVGKVVDGRYRLDRILGEGAAGAVYAATQLSVDRTVAVKLLHDADATRFATEAKAIAKLNHTNIITLHDFGYDSDLGAHFMVTEFAEGSTLGSRMREVMSTDLILRIGLEIASAIHHAHANGILHRDLKPDNVILTRADGRVDVAKVLDFGLAHLMDKADPQALVDEVPATLDELLPDEEAMLDEAPLSVEEALPDAQTLDEEPPSVDAGPPNAETIDEAPPELGSTQNEETIEDALPDATVPMHADETTRPMSFAAATVDESHDDGPPTQTAPPELDQESEAEVETAVMSLAALTAPRAEQPPPAAVYDEDVADTTVMKPFDPYEESQFGEEE